jgi:hypothetical protein
MGIDRIDSGQKLRSPYSKPLRAGLSGNRIPVEASFSAHLHIGSEVYPASITMDFGALPGIKRLRRVVNHPSSSSAVVKERVLPSVPPKPIIK